jgi:hypothetical protein
LLYGPQGAGPQQQQKEIAMSKYLILIYEDEAGYANGDAALINEVLEAHNRFGEKHADAIVGSNALEPTTAATTVRSDGAGGFTVTDGPFTETKEALGGYYLVEAADLDEAIAIAKDLPAKFGGVEVRPVMVFSRATRPPLRPRWPTRTVASGPTCSPRRCASPATSTSPRSACRTRTRRR